MTTRPTTEFAIDDSKVHNYRSVRGATAYRRDHATRFHRRWSTRAELKIYQRLFDSIGPIESVIDLPSGHGRLFDFLRPRVSGRIVEADFSQEMLDLNRADHDGAASDYLQCSALDIPLESREVDLAFSIRLNHHLESVEAREQHLRELFRVADKAVIVSWFSASSLKHRLRELRRRWAAIRSKNVMRDDAVDAIAASCGFRPVDRIPLSRIGSGHVFGLFTRDREADDSARPVRDE